MPDPLVQQTIDLMNAMNREQVAQVLMHVHGFKPTVLKSGACRFMFKVERKPTEPSRRRRESGRGLGLKHLR